MKTDNDNKKLQDKLKMFVMMMLTDKVRDDYPMVETIELTKFTKNEYTGKEYPEFIVKLNSNVSILTQTFIKQTIREYIESFFPDIFTLLNANIRFI